MKKEGIKLKNVYDYALGIRTFLHTTKAHPHFFDFLFVALLLVVSIPIWVWFGNGNFLIFWDGWAPMSTMIQVHQDFNRIFLAQVGTGTYSMGFTSYGIILIPYAILGFLFGPASAERVFYFLSYFLAGTSMYFLVREYGMAQRNELASFAAAIYYLSNFFWMSQVFIDINIPNVMTFLPLVFLLYRRYLARIKRFSGLFSHYLFLSVFSLVLIPGIFSQQSVAIYFFLFMYSIFSIWFFPKSSRKGHILVYRVVAFPVFAIVVFLTYSYFLWPHFIYSNLMSQYSGASSFNVAYLTALTSKATFFNVIRDIQPSGFYYYPFAFGQGVLNFAVNTPLYISLIMLIPTLFALVSPFLIKNWQRKESIYLLLTLGIVIFIQMGISGPLPTFYLWLGKHLPLGAIFENPKTTIGFFEPFLISLLIGIGLTIVTTNFRNKSNIIDLSGVRLYSSRKNGSLLLKKKVRDVLCSNSNKAFLVTVLIILSSLVSATPIFNGSFIPSYNSLHYLSYGPEISSKVNISPQQKSVYADLQKIIYDERVLVLPLETNVNMQSGNTSYVTGNSIIQLETGADVISDNTYGFGTNSTYILSSINDLIYNTYFYHKENYSMDQFFISTTNFSDTLSALGISYVLLVPNVPEIARNSYTPYVNYTMAEVFLEMQTNLSSVYSELGYRLYKNLESFHPSTRIVANPLSNAQNVVANFDSSIQWLSYNNTSKPRIASFENGFMFEYNSNQTPNFVVPATAIKAPTSTYHFLNIIGNAINASVSLYFVYNFESNYNQTRSPTTFWMPLTRYSDGYQYVHDYGKIQNISYSTSIPYLPWLGNGNVSYVDYFVIQIKPYSNLRVGTTFGFEIKDLFFSPFGVSLTSVAYELSMGGDLTYFVSGSEGLNSTLSQVGLPSEVGLHSVNGYQYQYSVHNAERPVILNLPITYNKYWNYKIANGINNVTEIFHVQTNGFENSYLVVGKGNYTIEVSYDPQVNISELGILSIVFLTTETILMLITYSKSRKKNIPNKHSRS